VKALAETGLKWCYACSSWKDSSTDFGSNRSRKDGLCPICKPCHTKAQREYHRLRRLNDPEYVERMREQSRSWATRNPEKMKRDPEGRLANARRSGLKRQGWTPESFEVAWEKQGGICPLCDDAMLKTGTTPKSACADHDHETGKARMLLCQSCNRRLGVYERNQAKFAAYVGKFKAN
jgi:hypothetical protein